MNNLDPEIDIQISEFEPFTYTAEVALVMPLPSKTYADPVLARHGIQGKDFGKPSEKVAEWIKSKNFGKVTQRLVFYRQVPGTPDLMFKTGEVEVTGYTCHVSYSKGGFKLGGYRFVGVVCPYTNAESEDADALYADVKLTDEFKQNATLADYLKKISAKIKCDGCGKKTSRSYYYVFMDKNDKLVFYGRNCAAKIFGIDVAEKLYNYMLGLNKLGEEFARPWEGGNVPGDDIKRIMSIMIEDRILGTNRKFDYREILDRADRIRAYETVPKWAWPSDGQGNSSASDGEFYMTNTVQLNAFLADFLTNGGEFFRTFDQGRTSEFLEKVKVIGINLTSGDDQALKSSSHRWAVPYALQIYFSAKISRQKMEAQREEGAVAEQYPQFNGYKAFDCVILHMEKKQSRNGREYMVVQAATEENGAKYGIQWFLWDWSSDLFEGKRLTVSGTYSKYNSKNSLFTTLDNVKMTDGADTPEERAQAQTSSVEIGQRLKGEQVKVKKVFDRSIVVTTNGGYDFYIYTKDFNTGMPKYPINFVEGMVLTVDGTMQVSNNGKPYLNRCKISA
jgi:hypothetical protein